MVLTTEVHGRARIILQCTVCYLPVDYKNDPAVFVRNPTIFCQFFSIPIRKDECKGLCCSKGKVELDSVVIPLEPLNFLLTRVAQNPRNSHGTFVITVVLCKSRNLQASG